MSARLILILGVLSLALFFSAVERQRRAERAQIDALMAVPPWAPWLPVNMPGIRTPMVAEEMP